MTRAEHIVATNIDDKVQELIQFRPENFSADNPFVQEILDTGIRVY